MPKHPAGKIMHKLIDRLLVALAIAGGSSATIATPIYFDDRALFESALGSFVTDGYDSYGTWNQFTNSEMSAVFGETRYDSITHPNKNNAGDVFSYGDRTDYCAGCNGNFKLIFDSTSFSVSGGVFGVGLDIELHSSRPATIGSDDPSNPTYPGTVLVGFIDGTTEARIIPADIGYYEYEPYFFGLTDDRGIALLTVGTEPGHNWVIDNLTVGSEIPVPPTVPLLGIALATLGLARARATK